MSSPSTTGVRHILLVEDNPADATLANIVHTETGHCSKLDVVRDGMEALRYLRQEGEFAEKPRPDVILLDMTLPMKSGLEMIGQIRATPGCEVMPIVMVSGTNNPVSLQQAYELGANCVIKKPSNWNEYFDKFETVYKFWCDVVALPESKQNGNAAT